MSDAVDRAAEAEALAREDRLKGMALRKQEQAQAGSYSHCEECGDEIPIARRVAVQGVRRCITCQSYFEKNGAAQ